MLLLFVLASMRCSERDVTSAELEGVWSITQESRERLPRHFAGISTTLALKGDGTFQAAGLPGELLYVRTPARDHPVSGAGRWSLQRQRDPVLTLDFLTITSGGEGRVPFRTEMVVSAGKAGARLSYFSGDADEGNRIDFEKR